MLCMLLGPGSFEPHFQLAAILSRSLVIGGTQPGIIACKVMHGDPLRKSFKYFKNLKFQS